MSDSAQNLPPARSWARIALRNPDDARLRAGWRIFLFVILFMSVAVCLQLVVRALLGGLPKSSPLIFVILAVSATLAVLVARRFLDRRSFLALGLAPRRGAVADLCFGFFLSGLMAVSLFSVMHGLGLIESLEIDLSAPNIAAVIGTALLITVLVGYWEELVFRGYLLQNLIDGLGIRIAVIVSCLIYGLVHAANPNASLLSGVIIVAFGFLRIYGYLATGQLWLSIGMHTGWNFFQGPVFGFAASGHVNDAALARHDPVEPAWLSGGYFGPEASVLTLPVLVATLWIMRSWSRRGDRTP